MATSQIAALVGVRDEVELIEKCIRHLQLVGIESIVVIDNNSRDGTEWILDRLSSAGEIELLRTSGDPLKDVDYFLRGVDIARSKFSPEWILVQDADEFWLHRSGDLNAIVRGATSEVLLVDRFNACLSERLLRQLEENPQPRFGELDLFVEPLRLSRATMDANPSIRWISGKPVEKVIARADAIAGVSAGGHGIIGRHGSALPSCRIEEAVIIHVPFSTPTRFQRKIENVKSLFDRHPALFSGGGGWHWRRWVELFEKGQLRAEFDNQSLSQATVDYLRDEGIVCRTAKYLEKSL
jgi:hypothetical protein